MKILCRIQAFCAYSLLFRIGLFDLKLNLRRPANWFLTENTECTEDINKSLCDFPAFARWC